MPSIKEGKKEKSGKSLKSFMSGLTKGSNLSKSAPPVTAAVRKEAETLGEPRRQRPKVVIHHPPWKVPTINDPFPNLEGQTQDNHEFNLYDYKGSSWAMIFTHPTDFTPVCTSEFVELLKLKPEFQANDVKIVGFSTNASDTSRNWLRDVEAIVNGFDSVLENSLSQLGTESVTSTASKQLSTGGLDADDCEIKVDFPIYSDHTLDMATELGILDEDVQDEDGCPVTARSIYILTPDNKIALITTYPSTVGRNWKEALRCILGLQVVEKSKYSVNIPSHWENGDKVLIDSKLDDSKCDTFFGRENWERVLLPSELCQEVGAFVLGPGGVRIDKKNVQEEAATSLPRHYMRYSIQPIDTNRIDN